MAKCSRENCIVRNSIKVLLIGFFLIFFVSCKKNDKKHIIDELSEPVTSNIETTNELNKIKEDIDKGKLDENTYGIKKETLIISDTFNKIEFKINYPIIYYSNNDEIEYLDYISSNIIDLIFEEVYNLYYSDLDKTINSNGINRVTNYPKDTFFDYKISYKDNNFLSIDYTWNYTEIIKENNFVSNLTINFMIEYDENGKIGHISRIKRQDIISDMEILEFIKNEDFVQLNGVSEVMEPFIQEVKKTTNIPTGYYLSDEILLKDNNRLGIIIIVPNYQGDICEIEIEYNWKDKLKKKYFND